MLPSVVDHLPLASSTRFHVAYDNPRRPIGMGEPDDIVVGMVQVWLVALGYNMPKSCWIDLDTDSIAADGIFGSETWKTIVQFQMDNLLTPDGLIGRFSLDEIAFLLFKRQNAPAPSVTSNASVTITKRPYVCPPGALICADPDEVH